MDGYRKVVDSGGSLDPDQEAAVNKYQEVIGSLEFAKELLKAFSGLSADVSISVISFSPLLFNCIASISMHSGCSVLIASLPMVLYKNRP